MAEKKQKTHYSGIGGQAVLEGVMMRNRSMVAIAVRDPDRGIQVEVDEHHPLLEGTVWTKIPVVRGVFAFIDALALGLRSTDYSAQFFEDETGGSSDKTGTGAKVMSVLTIVISAALACVLFIFLPVYLTHLVESWIRSAAFLSLLEGLIRIGIFLLYIALISSIKDIHRLYMYHGAEHKCINCIERGKPLTVHYVMDSSRFHKRCGTSFVFLVMLVSVVLFFFIRVDSLSLRLVTRVLLIPLVAGISYEILQAAGKSDGAFINALSKPGLWLQRITTREPDRSMIEVGIASVEAVFDWRSYLQDEFGYTKEELQNIDAAAREE